MRFADAILLQALNTQPLLFFLFSLFSYPFCNLDTDCRERQQVGWRIKFHTKLKSSVLEGLSVLATLVLIEGRQSFFFNSPPPPPWDLFRNKFPNIDSLLIVFENLNLKSLQFYELTGNVCAQNYQQFSAKIELINIVLESDNLSELS